MADTENFPYPQIQVREKNPKYAKMMLQNAASPVSESTSAAQYLYDSILTLQRPEISQVFRDIMHTEERHLELFLELAFRLGADPRLWYPSGESLQPLQYWTPQYVQYSHTLPGLLQGAIALEQAAITQYQAQLQEIDDEGISLVMHRILLDESLHIAMFRQLLQRL